MGSAEAWLHSYRIGLKFIFFTAIKGKFAEYMNRVNKVATTGEDFIDALFPSTLNESVFRTVSYWFGKNLRAEVELGDYKL